MPNLFLINAYPTQDPKLACKASTTKEAATKGAAEPNDCSRSKTTTMPVMSGSSGTKRNVIPCRHMSRFRLRGNVRRQHDTAAHSSEHMKHCSDPAVPLVLDGTGVATAYQSHVSIGRIKLSHDGLNLVHVTSHLLGEHSRGESCCMMLSVRKRN